LYAPIYDAAIARPTSQARRASLALLDLQAGERVLIVGCGTGLDFCHLPGGVTAVAGDVSPRMVRLAAQRASRVAADIDVRLMHADRFEEPDSAFDAAVLHLILAIVPDPEATMREVARVLRPGGRAVVFDKFMPYGGAPSIGRRLAEVGTRMVGTRITRRLEALVDGRDLAIERQEPSLLGGQFRIALLRRR
jgi:ubiquinone/menaquinone biosynthesis C-methylase UbiE